MKKTWDGLLVGPDQFDSKHPQLQRRAIPDDPQAIRNARPDVQEDNTVFLVYTNVGDGLLGAKLDTFSVSANLGEVTVTT